MDPQQLQQLEALCKDFYSSASSAMRSSAEQSLYAFLQSCSFPQLLSTISYSAMPQLVFLALSTLSKRITQQWNDLPLEDKLYTEHTLAGVLFESPGGRLESYAVAITAQALARVTRLGWLEHEQYRATVGQALEAGKQSHRLCAFALKYFEELINDIIEPVKARPMTIHRKVALNFRDEALFNIVKFTNLLLLQGGNLPRELLNQTLSVFYKCFAYDFLGIVPEEIGEDPVCIQIPLSWAPLIEDRAVLDNLEALCLSTAEETQHNVLRCINQIGAARKSVFSSAEQRRDYAERFLTTLSHISEQANLTSDALYEYVQLTKRFIMNYQLRELIELEAFQHWLQVFYTCSLRLFSNEAAIVSPFASGLGLWSYLATEVYHYIQHSQASLTVVVPNLFLNYLQTSLQFVNEELLVDSYPDLKDNLDCVGQLNAHYYSSAMSELQQVIDKLLPTFPSQPAIGQLAWTVYLSGALVGLAEKSLKEREEQLDSKSIVQVLDICRLSDQLPGYHPALEMSLLYYMNSLRKAYINTPHDTLLLFYSADHDLSPISQNEAKVLTVVDRIVQKILSILTRYQADQQLVSAALELLDELLKGYYSNKLVVQLPIAQQIMTQYRMLDLFKTQPKHRQRLYASLTQLWMGETATCPLDEYLEPMKQDILAHLSDASFSSDWVLLVLSELRGVSTAISNQKNYLLFFDWLYPSLFPLFSKILEQYIQHDRVITSLYRFLIELVTNRNSRIRFDISTANGIVLFKEIAQILIVFGKSVLERAVTVNIYKQKYRYVLMTLDIMTKLLAGGYVVFGVFQVYNDSCFAESLELSFRMIGCIPIAELLVLLHIELPQDIRNSHRFSRAYYQKPPATSPH
jgi:exportin-7